MVRSVNAWFLQDTAVFNVILNTLQKYYLAPDLLKAVRKQAELQMRKAGHLVQ